MTIRTIDGATPRIHDSAFVDPMAIVIGDVELAQDVFVLPACVIRGDVNWIKIGARSNIQDGTILHVNSEREGLPGGSPLAIGADVTVGHKVVLHGCEIHDHVLIGMGAIVLDGVVIESDVILGAGSLVTPGKRLESGFLYVGTPAKPLRALRADEMALIDFSNQQYRELKDKHRASCAFGR